MSEHNGLILQKLWLVCPQHVYLTKSFMPRVHVSVFSIVQNTLVVALLCVFGCAIVLDGFLPGGPTLQSLVDGSEDETKSEEQKPGIMARIRSWFSAALGLIAALSFGLLWRVGDADWMCDRRSLHAHHR